MAHRVIEGALPITAKLLAGDLDMEIVFGADGFAATVIDGKKTLYVPNLPLNDAAADDLALRGIVHEDGHFKHSQFDDFEQVRHALRELTNILEDIRIEVAQIERYAGARAILNNGVRRLVELGAIHMPSEADGLGAVVSYLHYRLRVAILEQSDLAPFATAASNVIEPIMPGASFQRLTAMMFDVDQCKSTADCRDLAVQIVEMLKHEAESEAPPPDANSPQEPQQQDQQQQQDQEQKTDGPQGQSSGDSGQSGQDGDGDGDPSQDQSSASGGQDDGQGTRQDQGQQGNDGQDQSQGQPSAPDAKDSGSSAQQSGNAGDSGDGTEASQVAEGKGAGGKAEAMQQFLAKEESGGESTDLGSVLSKALGQICAKAPDAVRLPGVVQMEDATDENHDADLLDRIAGETNAVRRRIINLLEANARTSYWHSRSGKDINASRLWRLRVGDARVFEKQMEGRKQNTAIQLLIDRSTSMRKDIHMATDAGLAVAMAMEGVRGISTSVAAFPCYQGEDHDDVMLVSEFDEPVRRIADRFPEVGVQGTTPMSEAMLWSGYHLHAVDRDRKILVVATDGKPNDEKSAKAIIESLEQSGIEVFGLGIKCDVSGVFPRSGYISSMNDLADALFGMLQETLAKAA